MSLPYGIIKPIVGGSQNIWGQILNDDLDTIAANLQRVDDEAFRAGGVADATAPIAAGALQRSGGQMTGRVDGHSGSLKLVPINPATGIVALDLAQANAFDLTVTGNITLSPTIPSALPPSYILACIVRMKQTGVGPWTVTVTGAKYPSGNPPVPTPTAGGFDVWLLASFDGGTTWQVSVLQRDVR
jgi:hypothetical protein